MTKKEMFASLISLVDGSSAENKQDLIDGLNHEIELLNKKSMTPRKPTERQLENETFKAKIVSFLTMADAPKCIREMQSEIAEFADLQNQRISHMLTDLVKNKVLIKTYVKKTPYFSINS